MKFVGYFERGWRVKVKWREKAEKFFCWGFPLGGRKGGGILIEFVSGCADETEKEKRNWRKIFAEIRRRENHQRKRLRTGRRRMAGAQFTYNRWNRRHHRLLAGNILTKFLFLWAFSFGRGTLTVSPFLPVVNGGQNPPDVGIFFVFRVLAVFLIRSNR